MEQAAIWLLALQVGAVGLEMLGKPKMLNLNTEFEITQTVKKIKK
jgi:hypothetical protein